MYHNGRAIGPARLLLVLQVFEVAPALAGQPRQAKGTERRRSG